MAVACSVTLWCLAHYYFNRYSIVIVTIGWIFVVPVSCVLFFLLNFPFAFGLNAYACAISLLDSYNWSPHYSRVGKFVKIDTRITISCTPCAKQLPATVKLIMPNAKWTHIYRATYFILPIMWKWKIRTVRCDPARHAATKFYFEYSKYIFFTRGLFYVYCRGVFFFRWSRWAEIER